MFGWKRPYRDWRLLAWYPLLVLMPASGMFAAVAYGSPGRQAWIVALTFGLVTAGLWRITQVGVLLNGDRIKVRNMFRTRILHWDDVSEVHYGTDFCGDRALAFVLMSGERVGTLVTTAAPGGHEVYT